MLANHMYGLWTENLPVRGKRAMCASRRLFNPTKPRWFYSFSYDTFV